jgi:hypothetical protein
LTHRERHSRAATIAVAEKGHRKSPSPVDNAGGISHLEIETSTGGLNGNRPRSGSWQCDQRKIDGDDVESSSWTDRRLSTSPSPATPDQTSPLTGCNGDSNSRKDSGCGSNEPSVSPTTDVDQQQQSLPLLPPQQHQHHQRHRNDAAVTNDRRVSSPSSAIASASPTTPNASSSQANSTSDLTTVSGQYQHRSSTVGLQPPQGTHRTDGSNGQLSTAMSSASVSRRRRSSSPRQRPSPASSAGRLAAAANSSAVANSSAGSRRNSAITYLSEVPSSSVAAFLLQSSAAARQRQRPDRGRRCSLQPGMLYTTTTTGTAAGESLWPPFQLAKSVEETIGADDDGSGSGFGASDSLLAGFDRRRINGCCVLAEEGCCSPENDGSAAADDYGQLRSTGGRMTSLEVYRIAVYGGQQVGKTTLVDQLLTSEYLANRKDDSGAYRGRIMQLNFLSTLGQVYQVINDI